MTAVKVNRKESNIWNSFKKRLEKRSGNHGDFNMLILLNQCSYNRNRHRNIAHGR